jgi:hypothetical protein
MAVLKKLKPTASLPFRAAQPKTKARKMNPAHNRPPGYFKDALTQEDIDRDNQVANAVARMNARHLSSP